MLADDDKWPLVHEYRRLSTIGEVPPILCPDCDAELVPTASLSGLPALRCLACVVVFNIALNTYEEMKENIVDASS